MHPNNKPKSAKCSVLAWMPPSFKGRLHETISRLTNRAKCATIFVQSIGIVGRCGFSTSQIVLHREMCLGCKRIQALVWEYRPADCNRCGALSRFERVFHQSGWNRGICLNYVRPRHLGRRRAFFITYCCIVALMHEGGISHEDHVSGWLYP